jgi:hypothetical protein
VRQSARGLVGTGNPEVVAAFGVFNPREKVACGCSGQRAGKGRAEDLLQRKGLGVMCMKCRGGKRGYQKTCSETHAARIALRDD